MLLVVQYTNQMYPKQNLLGFNPQARLVSPLKMPSPPVSSNPDRSQSPTAMSSSELPFLKKKLLETHNRLLQQLDKAKQYQQQIMDLSDQVQRQKECLEVQKKSKRQNGQQSASEVTLEALQNRLTQESDLRSKIQTQISKLKIQVKALRGQNRSLGQDLQNKTEEAIVLEKRVEVLKKKIERLQGEFEAEIETITLKAAGARKAGLNSAEGIQEENLRLKQKVSKFREIAQQMEMENRSLKEYCQSQHKKDKQSSEGKKGKLIDELKYEINRLNVLLLEKDRQLESVRIKAKAFNPVAKRGFEQTKLLVEDLERVQTLTRSRGLSRNLSQSTMAKSAKSKATESDFTHKDRRPNPATGFRKRFYDD